MLFLMKMEREGKECSVLQGSQATAVSVLQSIKHSLCQGHLSGFGYGSDESGPGDWL